MPSLLRALYLEDVKVELWESTLDLSQRALLLCINPRLLRQVLHRYFDFLRRTWQVQISNMMLLTGVVSCRLLLLEKSMITGFTFFSVRCVARLDIFYEFLDRYITKVRVAIQHDEVLHNFIECLFFALEEAGFDCAQRLLVQLPDVERSRLEQILGLSCMLLTDLLCSCRQCCTFAPLILLRIWLDNFHHFRWFICSYFFRWLMPIYRLDECCNENLITIIKSSSYAIVSFSVNLIAILFIIKLLFLL